MPVATALPAKVHRDRLSRAVPGPPHPLLRRRIDEGGSLKSVTPNFSSARRIAARPRERELAVRVAENAANGGRRMSKKRRRSSHGNYFGLGAGCESGAAWCGQCID